MPLLDLTTKQTIIIIVIMVPLIQIMGALIATKTPQRILSVDRWLFKGRKWEQNGVVYKKIFKVHKWKKYLPDGAKYFKGDFEKKQMKSFDPEYIEKFLSESCRAELVHWLGMIPFIIFPFLFSLKIGLILIVYSLIVNLPCIITQRYNRPRLQSILHLKQKHLNNKS